MSGAFGGPPFVVWACIPTWPLLAPNVPPGTGWPWLTALASMKCERCTGARADVADCVAACLIGARVVEAWLRPGSTNAPTRPAPPRSRAAPPRRSDRRGGVTSWGFADRGRIRCSSQFLLANAARS